MTEEVDVSASGQTSAPQFSTSFTPDLTVNIGGPGNGLGYVYNALGDGQTVTITSVSGAVAPTSCTTGAGFDGGPLDTFASDANCSVQVPPGEYVLSIPPQWTQSDPNFGSGPTGVYVVGDAVTEEVDVSRERSDICSAVLHQLHTRPHGQHRWSGNGLGYVYNALGDGQTVTITSVSGAVAPTSCTTGAGFDGGPLDTFASDANCSVQVPPGEYVLSIPPQWTQSDPNFGSGPTGVYVVGDAVTEEVDVSASGQTSAPQFSTSFTPDLTVNIGGPGNGLGYVYNALGDGQTVTITSVSGAVAPTSCTTGAGFDGGPLDTFASDANCSVQVPPGEYVLSIPPQWTQSDPNFGSGPTGVYVVGDAVTEEVDVSASGQTSAPQFSTSFTPDLTVNIGGPGNGLGYVYNALGDGQTVTITSVSGAVAPTSCTTGAGFDGGPLDTFASDANCSVQVPPGEYVLSIPPQWTQSDPNFGSGPTGVIAGDDSEEVDVSASGQTSAPQFSTSFLANSSSGSSTDPSVPATASYGSLSATASGGTGTVTVAQYSSDPVGQPSFQSGNDYFDVFLTAGYTFQSLTITACGSRIIRGGGTHKQTHGQRSCRIQLSPGHHPVA